MVMRRRCGSEHEIVLKTMSSFHIESDKPIERYLNIKLAVSLGPIVSLEKTNGTMNEWSNGQINGGLMQYQ